MKGLIAYSAFHTAILIIICVLLAITGIASGISYAMDDFASPSGKLLFGSMILAIVIPVVINTLSMMWHMLRNGRWLWFLGAVFFAFGVTVPYYFSACRASAR